MPPNLLVGHGATDFAWEHGIPVVPHDVLVSRNARDRFVRWNEDLRRIEGGRLTPGSSSARSSQNGEEVLDLEYEERVRNKQRRDHTNALLTGTWNEGQPDSPGPSPQALVGREGLPQSPPPQHSPSSGANSPSYMNLGSPVRSASRSPVGSPAKRPRHMQQASDGSGRTHSLLGVNIGGEVRRNAPNVGMSHASPHAMQPGEPSANDGQMSPNTTSLHGNQILTSLSFLQEGTAESPSKVVPRELDEDIITDTVGAIAIDMVGNIAAGSSSGGIGMKHRGRVGPAALVGVGTAVVPVDDDDLEGVSVAAVTSGTGEHMATTMASQKCADRLHQNKKRGRGGRDVEATEEEAMESFVTTDFMGHPGVNRSNSAGAIGVIAVKKTPYGYFLHFAHNTDSFALASMHSNEKDAKCVMSRIGDQGHVVQGGRKIRLD